MAQQRDENTENPSKLYKVIVRRALGEAENRNDPITVNTGSKETGGKRTFYPGEEVKLTRTQILILMDSKEASKIEIPDHDGRSAIYTSKDPILAAKEQWPGFEIQRDPVSGQLSAIRNDPVYFVEFQGIAPF
jgi:hypothetical protein